jgi:hypothetical protein
MGATMTGKSAPNDGFEDRMTLAPLMRSLPESKPSPPVIPQKSLFLALKKHHEFGPLNDKQRFFSHFPSLTRECFTHLFEGADADRSAETGNRSTRGRSIEPNAVD